MRISVTVLFSGLSLILAGAAEAGFGRTSLVGSYGCLGNSLGGVDAVSNQIVGLSELMQLNLTATGSITGTITVNSVGERCIVAVSAGSVFSVNPNGTGTMLLPLAASGMDLDSDQDCGGLLNGVAEHFDILILGSGGKFDLQSADDMFTSPKLTADNKRDIPNPFTGTCEKQTPP